MDKLRAGTTSTVPFKPDPFLRPPSVDAVLGKISSKFYVECQKTADNAQSVLDFSHAVPGNAFACQTQPLIGLEQHMHRFFLVSVFVGLVLTQTANGQIELTAIYSASNSTENVTVTDAYTDPGYDIIFIDNQYRLHANSWVTGRASRNAPTATLHRSAYFNFKNNGLPVLLSNLTLSTRGKLVVAGATDDDYSSLTTTYRLFEFEDDNFNDIYDQGEAFYPLSGITHMPVPSASGTRLEYYDLGEELLDDVLLGGSVHFAIEFRHLVRLEPYEVDQLDPNIWLTTEFQYPEFDFGLNFNFQTVPEPSQLALMLPCCLFFIGRARRRAPEQRQTTAQ